jgi:peroxiredoxin/Tfp pilus assembly protein PilF
MPQYFPNTELGGGFMNRVADRVRIRRLLHGIFALGAMLFVAGWTSHSADAQSPQSPSTNVGNSVAALEMQSGAQFLQRKQYEEALKSFKHANELLGGACAECEFQMAIAFGGMGAHKNAADSAQRAVDLAKNDARLRADAYNLKGQALQAVAEGKDVKKLQEAEAALREGLKLGVALPALNFNLGVVLMQQSRDADGAAELKRALEMQPAGPAAERAHQMLLNPRRAREPYAPDFSVVTADGQYLSLADLEGKVVLLDFWGTWCPPCVAALPAVRDTQKRLSKDPFVLVSVSSDSDESVWRTFIAKNQMTWPQYWDREKKIQQAFDVRAFPTYIVLDQEGIVRFRSVGQSFERNAQLDDAVKKQLKALQDGIIHVRAAR